MKYTYSLAIIILIFLVCSHQRGQGNCDEINSNIKPISMRLNNEVSSFKGSSYIDRKVHDFLSQWDLRGASVAISKDGRLVYAKGYGTADVKNDKEVTPSSLFRFASVSKLITATTIMKLVEDGKLSVKDKVFGENGILNDSIFLKIKDRRYKQISVEHLLRHEAGFSSRIRDPLFRPLYVSEVMGVSSPADNKASVRYQLTRRLSHKPGTRVVYSNLGYVILSLVIEEITNMPYEDYVKNMILAPCGVYDMHLAHNFPEEKYNNEVCYYEQEGTNKIKACDGSDRIVYKCNGGTNVRGLSGAGGWVGSASELIKFVSCIDGNDNKPDILSKKSIKYMTNRIKGKLPIGWMKVDYKNNWWRTGTLAGSTILLKKMNNGMSWVLVANTSSWRGSKFPRAINGLMSRVLRKVKDWPEYDLFNYYTHKPIVLNIDEESNKNNRSS
jgi:CubicO group peptidase (beta-lactamase class C family)